MSRDDRRARLDALFERVLERPAAERPEFLSGLEVDPSLRAELAELLALAEEGDESPPFEERSLLSALDHALSELPAASEITGRRFGAWRVIEALGRGGMGAVYLVERADGEFEQRAAMKLLRQGVDSLRARQRFEHERQILASLDHPGIARLLDGGTAEDGQPFLVMELVRGETLLRHCDRARLGIEERLALFCEIGRALAYAHRHLVVHRDVKPSNVAVTEDGGVKLLDFGIAKLLAPAAEDVAPTAELARPLTPEYASPEQVRGDPITTAADIYQLGLLLFELLAGGPAQPVTGLTGSALERAVCERPVERPSGRAGREASAEIAARRGTTPAALRRRLSGDLDAIVGAATRKEPERRYASVGELVDDVERHRRGLPIRARPDRLHYRAAKFARRHRAAVTWASIAVMVSAWGLAGWARQRMRIREEARRATEIERVLGQLLTFADAGVSRQPPSVHDYLAQAARLVRDRLRDQPGSQSRLLAQLGRAYTVSGYYRESIELFEQALAVRPPGGGPPSVVDLLGEKARGELFVGSYASAEVDLRQAIEMRRAAGESPDLMDLVELGDLHHTQGHLLEAERVLRQAVTGLRAAGSPDSLAESLRDLGNVLRDRGLYGDGEAAYRESIALFKTAGYDDGQLAATAVEPYYARLLILTGRLSAAQDLLDSCVARLRRLYPKGHPLLATVLREEGFLRIEQGRYGEAGADLAQAHALLRDWLGEEHPLVPRNASHEAELLRRRGRLEESVSLARETIARFERLGIAEHPAAIDARTTLGAALLDTGQGAAAADAVRPALAVAVRQFVAGDSRTRRLEALLATAESR